GQAVLAGLEGDPGGVELAPERRPPRPQSGCLGLERAEPSAPGLELRVECVEAEQRLVHPAVEPVGRGVDCARTSASARSGSRESGRGGDECKQRGEAAEPHGMGSPPWEHERRTVLDRATSLWRVPSLTSGAACGNCSNFATVLRCEYPTGLLPCTACDGRE